MIVTAAILRRKKACKEQVDMFVETFGAPAKVKITEALCVKHAQKFNWNWAAQRLLRAVSYAEYLAKRAPRDTDYDAKIATLCADYRARREPLEAEYRAKREPLYAEYRAKCAAIFGRIAETVED